MRGKLVYTRLEEHDYNNGQYTITNKAYRSTTDMSLGSEMPLTMIDRWADIQLRLYSRNRKTAFCLFFGTRSQIISTRRVLSVSRVFPGQWI